MNTTPDQKSKHQIAAEKIRDIADALFIFSRNPRSKGYQLDGISEKLRVATAHRCLHILRQADIPYAAVLVAMVSDQDMRRHEKGNLTIQNINGWVTGPNKIILEVLSLDPDKDKELAAKAAGILDGFTSPNDPASSPVAPDETEEVMAAVNFDFSVSDTSKVA